MSNQFSEKQMMEVLETITNHVDELCDFANSQVKNIAEYDVLEVAFGEYCARLIMAVDCLNAARDAALMAYGYEVVSKNKDEIKELIKKLFED